MARVLPASGVTSAVALVGATGVAVGVGVVVSDGNRSSAADLGGSASDSRVVAGLAQHDTGTAGTSPDRAAQAGAGTRQVSRGSDRPPLASVQRATKSRAMPVAKQAMAGGLTETVAPPTPPASPQDVAISMLDDYGWSTSEFGCLDELYLHESGWSPSAQNPTSGAYGIPQALPADKMAEYGDDWQTNPTTQLEWGLSYIRDSYGSPCGAWSFWQSNSWY